MGPLGGGRVRLRDWCDADREPFAQLNADAEVMRYFPSTLTEVESNAMADRIATHIARWGFGLWAVEVDGMFAGYCGLNRTAFDTPMGPHVEVGWRLARWAWGKGLATEAATLVLDDGFGRCGLNEVFSFTTVTNVRSRAVMERLGMVRRPECDFDHPGTPQWWGQPHVVYGLDRAQWVARRVVR